jgi:hypothetical protein
MSPAWLANLVDRLRAARSGPATRQERRVLSVLGRRGELGDERLFLEALSAELFAGGSGEAVGAPEVIQERTVELLAAHLRGHCGEELDRIGPHLPQHLDFWAELASRSGNQLARACHADLLLMAHERDRALDEFLDALDEDPALVRFQSELAELAREREGESWLRYRLACLRAALVGLLPDGDDDGANDDYARELYCELLEEHRADPGAMARIRELGVLLDQAVDRGDLPRAIVRRAPRD